MRHIFAGTALLVLLGAMLAQAQETGPTEPPTPASLADSLFAPAPQRGHWRERDALAQELQGHYVGVANSVVAALGGAEARSGAAIAYGSPVHHALLVAGSWRVDRAKRLLVCMATRELDVTTIPHGVCMSGAGLFPAANALTRLDVQPAEILPFMSEESVSILTWVLARTYGREGAAVLLERVQRKNGAYDAMVGRALELLESVDHVSDLLRVPAAADQPK